MRRTPRAGNEVTRAWRVPWWRRCRCCGDDFKREHAWAGFWSSFYAIPRIWYKGFVCLKCSPSGPGRAMEFFGVQTPAVPDIPCPPPPPKAQSGSEPALEKG